MLNQTPSCIHVNALNFARRARRCVEYWTMIYEIHAQSADENGTQWMNHRNNMYSSRTQGEQVELAPHTYIHQA